MRTAALVADRLRAAGLAVHTGVGGHGVVGVIDGPDPGPALLYRADMDAVAGDERYVSGFASQVPGAAHLCGHDLHTAIGVGVAETLARLRDRLAGRVVFVFQPAEETLEGARAMIDDGVLDRYPAREAYALHCAPLPVGVVAALPGAGLPGQDTCQVEFTGPGAAGTARQFLDRVGELATVTKPRSADDFAALVAALQTPDGPLAGFVFAESHLAQDGDPVVADVWLRVWPESRHAELRDRLRQLAAQAGAVVTFPGPPFPAMVCSTELSEAAATYLRDVPGVAEVMTARAAWPFNGEDFALFLHRVPGAMFWLGVADPGAGVNGITHAPDFAADERAIGVGVRAMAGLLLHRLRAA
ncbi:M20/M25/M40 family metallo-hydrolase [Dactylosporangium sp. NBC_01737]|uniref:M20 metallopeptidase family protein n=1 Tax=Dactylosporangium sp. NBC_01737 TaxID=2975959 RepID=UPI002E136056|nr:M20/M25/M40 family metallo-hydrolase [Dactylosporangium sp. NBC_01737]